jgi:phosphatidylserine/phosphatidylglycerophosphate/cardiolipin synthase-like enzyme
MGFLGVFGSAPQLLTDGAIYTRVRELIVGAQEELLIVSPYIDPTDDFVRQLHDAADSRQVQVRVVFRQDKLAEYRGSGWFRELAAAGVTLAVIDRLHSKIYRNEAQTIVTSMNFYSSSGENSFEVGVLFEAAHALSDQTSAYVESLERHMELVVGGSQRKQNSRGTSQGRTARVRESARGHCLRCGDTVPFNPERPYCADDYAQWARYKNENFEDRYCHRCGAQHPATMRKPLCRDCYEQVR